MESYDNYLRGRPTETKQKKTSNLTPRTEIEYEEALAYARTLVKERYGSVTAFTKHPDFHIKCDFAAGEAHKVRTYLSRPAEGTEKLVKSAPFLNQLLRGLVGVGIESGRKVVHTTTFYCLGELPPLPAQASKKSALVKTLETLLDKAGVKALNVGERDLTELGQTMLVAFAEFAAGTGQHAIGQVLYTQMTDNAYHGYQVEVHKDDNVLLFYKG